RSVSPRPPPWHGSSPSAIQSEPSSRAAYPEGSGRRFPIRIEGGILVRAQILFPRSLMTLAPKVGLRGVLVATLAVCLGAGSDPPKKPQAASGKTTKAEAKTTPRPESADADVPTVDILAGL